MATVNTLDESSCKGRLAGDVGAAPKKPLRVFLLLTSTAGGVGVHAHYLAGGLPRDEFEVTVGYGPGYPLDQKIESLGLPVEHFSISRKINPLTNLRGLLQVVQFLRRGSFDIVCTECSIAGLIGRLAGWAAGVPVRIFIIQLHASHPVQSKAKQLVYRQIERFLDPFTTHYVAVSQAMKDFGVAHGIFAAEKASVIYNGITIHERRREGPGIREELGIAADTLLVGTLARLEPQKGLEHLIKAAPAVREQVPNVKFLIAGDGPLEPKLKALARELEVDDIIHWAGWRTDVWEILSAIDVFAFPSLWESFGIALAEAMLMEKAVVATDIDGVREVVDHGRTGVLVPPADAYALAQALIHYLQDENLRDEVGIAGRKRVCAMFDVDAMVHRYGETFQKLHRGAIVS